MSKKNKLLTNIALISSMIGMADYTSCLYDNKKHLEGSAIYIPKRHKFKKKNKR